MKSIKRKMNWISDEHKRLYSQAFSALYQDVKTSSLSIINKSKTLINDGYETAKKYYYDMSDDDYDSNNDNSINDISNNDNFIDDKLVEMGDFYPDVLVILHREKHYLCKIYVIDDKGHKIPIKGKIHSYKYIHNIIDKWFIYQKFEAGYKWLPTEELYTAYRGSSSMLSPIDNILFRYGRNEYYPQRYHPLI